MNKDKPREARDRYFAEIRDFSKSPFRKDNYINFLTSLRYYHINFGYFDYYINRNEETFKLNSAKSAFINRFLYEYYFNEVTKLGGLLYFEAGTPFLSDNLDIIENVMQTPYENYVIHYFPAKHFLNVIKNLYSKDFDHANEYILAFEKHVQKKDRSMAGIPGVLRGILEKDLNIIDENIERSIKLLTHRASFDILKVIDFETLVIAKVASFFGYETRVEHPLVPKELVPFKPLEKYETIDFLKDKETYESFALKPWYKKLF